MTKNPGALLVITGSGLYHSHEAREMGFRAVLRSAFSHVHIAASLTGPDNVEETCEVVTQALTQFPDLAGIYNVGGGNEGLVRALKRASVEQEIVVVGHNLTSKTNAYLLEDSMDAVTHQNLQMAARETVGALLARLAGGR